jgi:hypothetical protein
MYAKLCNLFHVYLDKILESIYNNTTSKNNYFINEWEERGEYIKITEPDIHKILEISNLFNSTYIKTELFIIYNPTNSLFI